MAPDEKSKAVELAIAQIERQHGKGAIMRYNSDDIVPVDVIPTGSIALDIALGTGGVPRSTETGARPGNRCRSKR